MQGNAQPAVPCKGCGTLTGLEPSADSSGAFTRRTPPKTAKRKTWDRIVAGTSPGDISRQLAGFLICRHWKRAWGTRLRAHQRFRHRRGGESPCAERSQ